MTRYTLADQLHFLAPVADRGDTVVTMQHWQNAAGDKAVYVVTYNGVEHSRKFADDPRDVASLIAHFASTRTARAEELLSEEGAANEVVRRGGPGPRYCVKADCPAGIAVPYAADMCAAGDLVEDRGRIEFLSVTTKYPPLTVVTGGKK